AIHNDARARDWSDNSGGDHFPCLEDPRSEHSERRKKHFANVIAARDVERKTFGIEPCALEVTVHIDDDAYDIWERNGVASAGDTVIRRGKTRRKTAPIIRV